MLTSLTLPPVTLYCQSHCDLLSGPLRHPNFFPDALFLLLVIICPFFSLCFRFRFQIKSYLLWKGLFWWSLSLPKRIVIHSGSSVYLNTLFVFSLYLLVCNSLCGFFPFLLLSLDYRLYEGRNHIYLVLLSPAFSTEPVIYRTIIICWINK